MSEIFSFKLKFQLRVKYSTQCEKHMHGTLVKNLVYRYSLS